MGFTPYPVFMTSAAAGIFLVVFSFGIAVYLLRIQRHPDRLKVSFWLAGIGLLGVTGLAGSINYGFNLSGMVILGVLDKIIDLCRVLAVGMFLCGMAYDLHGPEIALLAVPFVTIVGFGFYLAAMQFSVLSTLVSVYEILGMLPIFIVYSWFATRFRFHGARWMSFSAVLFILAALVQANPHVRLELIWLFDSDGLATVIRTLGLLSLAFGLRSALLPYRGAKIENVSPVL